MSNWYKISLKIKTEEEKAFSYKQIDKLKEYIYKLDYIIDHINANPKKAKEEIEHILKDPLKVLPEKSEEYLNLAIDKILDNRNFAMTNLEEAIPRLVHKMNDIQEDVNEYVFVTRPRKARKLKENL